MPDGEIFAAMVSFFKDDDWDFQQMDGMPVLSMPFVGRSGRWICYAQAREQQEQFVFYSVCPVNAPPDRTHAVTEFITRANYGMIIGNFELDYSDGEVRYKTSIAVEQVGLKPELVRHMVYANVVIMDRYLNGLMRVIYGNAIPEEEIEEIEGDVDDTNNDMDTYDDISPELADHIERLLQGIDTDEDDDGLDDLFGVDEDNEDDNPGDEDA